jgi:hypothetical protein
MLTTATTDPVTIFEQFIAMSDEGLSEKLFAAYEQLKQAGIAFSLAITETTDWEDSAVEGYSKAPTVKQDCKLAINNCIVAEWQRSYGSELVDYTHTGSGGNWTTLLLDIERQDIEDMLEIIGICIIEPDVPQWIAIDSIQSIL